MNPELDEMMASSATMLQMLNKAREQGYHPMANDGVKQVVRGDTTIEELSRVVDLTAGLS